ncbi:hypothetical protein CAPTEDRAFT_214595 [Capitella teleta]|uniref:F5/8 type C domain-containing protein n=1 Tax=Capitella teleta TaxID=283909 RepID=R7VIH8_CAPTE|nr:hypothetical protein CAPTEDRAFT_214595 [Capitella teleta]|eukprot:ELU16096.1 hypothetical protein CAPTEDRAFT_214595 [Capitella teleta]
MSSEYLIFVVIISFPVFNLKSATPVGVVRRVSATHPSCQCGGFAPLITDVDDAQVFASPHEEYHNPVRSKNSGESWWPKNNSGSFGNPWIGVDFTTNRIIAGVATSSSFSDDGVETFSIDYRLDGSDIWINHTDADGNITIFLGCPDYLHATLNEFPGGIYARYVRLHVLSYRVWPKVKWELFGCNYCPFKASYDGSTTGCIKTTDTVNNQIRMQWKGLATVSNVMNLVLSGRSLICSNYFTKVGIEVASMGCKAEYAMCKIEGSGVNGTCHAVCGLRDGQVGQPFSLLLMVTGDDAELCDVSMGVSVFPIEPWTEVNLTGFPVGRNVHGRWYFLYKSIPTNIDEASLDAY